MKNLPSPFTFPAATPTISLRLGQILVDGGQRLILETKLEANKWIVRNTEDGSTLKLAEFDIISGLTSGQIQIQNDKSVSIQRGNRTELAVAIHDMMQRKMWIENLKNAGIERIVDEPWVRSAINKLAQGAL